MSNALDLTGKTFGKLTAIEPTGERDKWKCIIWRFRCECGAIIERTGSYITRRARNSTPSCGSSKCAAWGLPLGESARNHVANRYRREARERDLPFNLTSYRIDALFAGNCFYCNSVPSTTLRNNRGSFTYNGIDRLDNREGYIPGNVVSCCPRCNRAKDTASVEQFIAWAQCVATHQNRTVP